MAPIFNYFKVFKRFSKDFQPKFFTYQTMNVSGYLFCTLSAPQIYDIFCKYKCNRDFADPISRPNFNKNVWSGHWGDNVRTQYVFCWRLYRTVTLWSFYGSRKHLRDAFVVEVKFNFLFWRRTSAKLNICNMYMYCLSL